MKTKTIRIKKRGGGTRLQKVQVLASGKYRFLKNPTSKTARKPSKTTTKGGRKRPMARKRRSRRRRGFTVPLAPVLGLAAGLAEPAALLMQGNPQEAMTIAIRNYTGVTDAGRPGGQIGWDPNWLMHGLMPVVIGAVVHKFVGGPPLNLNKTLAAANVPVIRI